VNYPLADLQADLSLAEKNHRLDEWVRAKLAAKALRYYPEATYLFDE